MPIITAGGANLVAKFELRKKVRRVRTFLIKNKIAPSNNFHENYVIKALYLTDLGNLTQPKR